MNTQVNLIIRVGGNVVFEDQQSVPSEITLKPNQVADTDVPIAASEPVLVIEDYGQGTAMRHPSLYPSLS